MFTTIDILTKYNVLFDRFCTYTISNLDDEKKQIDDVANCLMEDCFSFKKVLVDTRCVLLIYDFIGLFQISVHSSGVPNLEQINT